MGEESLRRCIEFLCKKDPSKLSIDFRYNDEIIRNAAVGATFLPPAHFSHYTHGEVDFCFKTNNREQMEWLSRLNCWGPLLRKLKELQNIEFISIETEPPRILLPVFLQWFQFFQRNNEISSLSLNQFDFYLFIFVYWLEAEGAVVPQHCLSLVASLHSSHRRALSLVAIQAILRVARVLVDCYRYVMWRVSNFGPKTEAQNVTPTECEQVMPTNLPVNSIRHCSTYSTYRYTMS